MPDNKPNQAAIFFLITCTESPEQKLIGVAIDYLAGLARQGLSTITKIILDKNDAKGTPSLKQMAQTKF